MKLWRVFSHGSIFTYPACKAVVSGSVAIYNCGSCYCTLGHISPVCSFLWISKFYCLTYFGGSIYQFNLFGFSESSNSIWYLLESKLNPVCSSFSTRNSCFCSEKTNGSLLEFQYIHVGSTPSEGLPSYESMHSHLFCLIFEHTFPHFCLNGRHCWE